MNWTFSIPAILIFVLLFCFSLTSFYFFFRIFFGLRKLEDKDFRFQLFPKEPTEAEQELFFSPLERTIRWLPTIASLSMLLGLLGTVIGINSAFGAMEAQGKVSLEVLAGGIKDALNTTIAGLLVAIPSLYFHRFAENKIRYISELMVKDFSTKGP
ncbi:MotA/TolQ/ExbB proton channel family protein [Leptospira bandrabouensis]|uniref:MotA/TolQ/ExbB proton channel family protein n=1 Tax=Leptospira bandrabouensis TaxID=2484903 RepID=UPI001ABF6018|nr:MotA/TolQ/ExbB proton channel family protein [Leptospira bandrabouensis]MCG6146383.1 MotA/TolQ/ExbB proton channel family protein [Leptospira bandrabouensis]MCG6153753.1 MotA/TolQ/ExbB proton channel family protein [Leptospira bandrabouensis]MCG6161202.1 MotA/TolQ/ExbB proton channel family protein [Leptospira bandrabouensis]MCG6165970.1 MotA/TolQ/ExbB proton channel family protein [Leptospira bandrabouensis]MCW7458035.1 MotA/TolQ/ExbB proton channel family protein [Leptospira bandrabouensi